MNVAQITRKAQFEIDALRTGNVASAMWSSEELVDAANTAMDRAARIIRLADSDLLTKTIESDDDSVDLITETYDPGSLSIVSGTADYTLPPDCVGIVGLRSISSGYEGVRFRPAQTSQKFFIEHRSRTSDEIGTANGSEQVFYWTQIGGRTLRITPTPQDSMEVELVYRFRPARLLSYSTGTITVTRDSTTVTGLSTDWSTAGLRTPAELVVGTSVDLNRHYPRITSFSGDTALTLTKAYAGSTGSSQSYIIAMVPQLPQEHHAWLAQMTAAILLRKVSVELSDQSKADLEKQLEGEVRPEVTVRQNVESLPVEPFELP